MAIRNLLHFLGFQKCFTCQRWRILHSVDQAARCDYAPLPMTVVADQAAIGDDDGHRRGVRAS